MRRVDIVLGAIEQNGVFHLQFRDGDPKIGAAGMIGFFGGKIEDGEDPTVAVCREIGEETTLQPDHYEVSELGTVEVISDHQLETVQVFARVFHMLVNSPVAIEAREGTLVKLSLREALEQLHAMTPGTRACFEELIKN